MDDLLELNKQASYAKLDDVFAVDDCYRANDLIDAISSSSVRDKRLINGYAKDEVITMKTTIGAAIKTTRMFTKKGLARYIHEGKLYDYANVCGYFNIEIRDKQRAEDEAVVEACRIGGKQETKYKTRALLKWLHGKRKQIKDLNDEAEIADILMYATDADPKKIKVLREICGL